MSGSKTESKIPDSNPDLEIEKTYKIYLDFYKTIEKEENNLSTFFSREKVLGFYAFLISYFNGNVELGIKTIELHRKKISVGEHEFQIQEKMDIVLNAYQLYRAVWIKEMKKAIKATDLLDEMIFYLFIELQVIPSKSMIKNIEKSIDNIVHETVSI